jgi:hypothetical protein
MHCITIRCVMTGFPWFQKPWWSWSCSCAAYGNEADTMAKIEASAIAHLVKMIDHEKEKVHG